MWWKNELKRRRQEVSVARRRLVESHKPSPLGHDAGLTPVMRYLPAMIAAGFAAGALLGPKRAVKLAAVAAPVMRMGRAVTQFLSVPKDVR